MRVRRLLFAALLLILPAESFAQSANPLTANAKIQLGALTGFVLRSAEKVPEELYPFRATPEVRSMGELFGHIADALFGLCSTAAGSKPPRTGIEKAVTAKLELIAALKEGVSYCNTVFDGMTDQKGVESVPFYFGPTPRLSVLYFVVTHTYEHYGNLVTYMRLKNIVPPSSEPTTPGAASARAQTTMLPFDHIHVNEPADEASQWWEKNIPGGRRITEGPNRIMYGAVRLMFLGARSTGGSDGSVLEHVGFSVPDLDATLRALAAIGTKVIEPVKDTPGLYKTAMIESPWGTRVQLVQDPELVGLHHVQLRSADPDGMFKWLLDKFGGERTKLKGQIDAVKYAGAPGFTTVYIVAAKGSSVPSQGRAIDHIGWRSMGTIVETKAMLEGKSVQLTSQPRPLELPNGPSINFFYVAGPDGARIEIVERPGLKPGQ